MNWSAVLLSLGLSLGIFGCNKTTVSTDGFSFLPDGFIVGPDPDMAMTKKVFVTSSTYNGDLGGLSGGDMRCQNAATGAGLMGTFVAWLSDSSTNAIDHVTGEGPWDTLDGTRVFNNKAGLGTTPLASIHIDQNKNDQAIDVWTGTDVGGTHNSSDCSDWSGSSILTRGKHGNSYATDSTWTADTVGGCDAKRALYCFEQ